MKKFYAFLLFILGFAFYASPAFADSCSGQYGQYGSCAPSMSIAVSKMVGKPDTSVTKPEDASYVDNLIPSDPRFKADQTVYYRIRVRNTSGTKLYNVTLKDFVPSYINPVQGPGTYDPNSRIITYAVGDMDANQENIYYIRMQVVNQNNLPSDKGLFCIVNKAEAYNDKTYDSSTSQLCIEKQVAGISTTKSAVLPAAGPEMGLILLGLNIAFIGTGLALKRKI